MSDSQVYPEVDITLMEPQITEAAEAFADEYTTPVSDAVLAIREETQTATKIPLLLSGVKESRVVEGLAVATGARRILEVGTFTGATTLALAEALPDDVEIITLEVDPSVAAIARKHFDASPAGHKIDLRLGDALEIIESLDGPFDVMYIDAWKKHYVDYYEALLPKLAPRGIMLCDDVVWSGMPFNEKAQDVESEGIRRFVRQVQDDPRVHNVMLTVGEGIMMIWHASQA